MKTDAEVKEFWRVEVEFRFLQNCSFCLHGGKELNSDTEGLELKQAYKN